MAQTKPAKKSPARKVRYGYSLFCEGFDPRDLVEQAVLAEAAGFDFVVISDHFHPWLGEQQHAGFAWSILGAIAQATSKIELATMVTCPIMRYHPAIVAQAAATVGVLSNGRFTLGLGAGERLNEHITGEGWPSARVRRDMLREAIEIIRRLWTGKYVSFEGQYFQLDDARIFDLPDQPLKLYLAAGGPESAALAAEIADGVCNTEPNPEVFKAYTGNGGDAAAIWGQIVTSWAKDDETGLQNAHRQFRFATGGWKVQAELPNPVNFDAATKLVEPDDLAELLPAGPDAAKHAKMMKQFTDAGVTNLAVVYPGQDTKGYMKFWQEQLRPLLP
jgi:G6PDH family F420-dependent oxidoreductase